MVRNTVMSTVKDDMVVITVSHVGCSRENQMDREQVDMPTHSVYKYLCTHLAFIHPSITGYGSMSAHCYLDHPSDPAAVSASFVISRELAIVAVYFVVR